MQLHHCLRTYSLIPYLLLASCGNPGSENTNQSGATDNSRLDVVIKTSGVDYVTNGQQSIGYIAYDESRKERLPVVVIIPEWWGLVDYVKKRAGQLAKLGYFAFVADVYGNGKTADNPQDAMALSKPFYTNPQLSKGVIEAAITKAGTYTQADTNRVAAIGYCFGGFIVLNAAKLGAPLKGVVSFHGGLGGVQPIKGVIRGEILVCQGGADPFVPEIEQAAFRKSMDSIGANYTFISYPGALHAFSNPNATALGEKFKLPLAYNAAADTASWKDMLSLFQTVLRN